MSNVSLPKLVVFGLDYTLWAFVADDAAPPFTKLAGTNQVMDACDIELTYYKEVLEIFQTLTKQGMKIGVVSDCKIPSNAAHLLTLFDFNTIHKKSGIPYTDMLYFDNDYDNVYSVKKILAVIGHEVSSSNEDGLTIDLVYTRIRDFMNQKEEYPMTEIPPITHQVNQKEDHFSTQALSTTHRVYRFSTSIYSVVPETGLPQLIVFGLSDYYWPFFGFQESDEWSVRAKDYLPFLRNARNNRLFGGNLVEVKCYKRIANILDTLTKEGVKIGVFHNHKYECTDLDDVTDGLLKVSGMDKYIFYKNRHWEPSRVHYFVGLHNVSDIPYTDMLFFDNTHYVSSVDDIEKVLGIVRYEIPHGGLTVSTIRAGIGKYLKIQKKFDNTTPMQRLNLLPKIS